MTLNNMKLSVRLGLGYGVIFAFLIGIAGLGIVNMSHTDETLHRIVDINVKKIGLLQDMSESVHIVSRVIRSIALLSDQAAAANEHKKIDQARAQYGAAFATLQAMPLDDAGKSEVAKIKLLQEGGDPLNDQFAAMAKTDRDAATVFLLKDAGPANTLWLDAIRAFTNLQKTKNQQALESAVSAYQSARLTMLI